MTENEIEDLAKQIKQLQRDGDTDKVAEEINKFIGEGNFDPPDKMSPEEIISWNYLIDISEYLPETDTREYSILLTLALLIVDKMLRQNKEKI